MAGLQDDMELAPDFFTYFEAMAPLLDADNMLMCISSWNDHGQVQPSHRPCRCSVLVFYASAMSEVAAETGSMLTCLVRVANIEWHHNALAGPVCEGHTEAVPHRLLPRLRVDA